MEFFKEQEDKEDDFICAPSPKKRKQAGNVHCNYHTNCFITALIDLSAQKKSIEEYLHQIEQGIELVQEPEILKRVLSLVMQANSSLQSVSNSTIPGFIVKERFAPAQKNETQLHFKKTSSSPGRRTKNKKLRYNSFI